MMTLADDADDDEAEDDDDGGEATAALATLNGNAPFYSNFT